jgi:Mg2+/Co2+ transporter CorB
MSDKPKISISSLVVFFCGWGLVVYSCVSLYETKFFNNSSLGTATYFGALTIYSLCSAFFSSTETAFTIAQTDYEDTERFNKKLTDSSVKDKTKRLIFDILDDDEGFSRFLSLALVCNNVVNLVGMALLAILITQDGETFNTLMSTLAVLFLGEIFAKNYANVHPYRVLNYPMVWIIHLLWKSVGRVLHTMVNPIVKCITGKK